MCSRSDISHAVRYFALGCVGAAWARGALAIGLYRYSTVYEYSYSLLVPRTSVLILAPVPYQWWVAPGAEEGSGQLGPSQPQRGEWVLPDGLACVVGTRCVSALGQTQLHLLRAIPYSSHGRLLGQ